MSSATSTLERVVTPVETPKRTLIKKLAEIMGEVDRVPKAGRNNFHNYDYATEADIAAAVRAAMAKRSVMLIPSVEKTDWTKVATKSSEMRLCTLTVRFTLHDGDSGETLEYVVLGEGSDSGDKATYKALTGAEKYALLKIFLIPTGDDPERDDSPAAAQQQPAQTRTESVKAKLLAKNQPANEPPPPTDDDAPGAWVAPPKPIEERRAAPKTSAKVTYGKKCKGMMVHQLSDKDLDWYLLTSEENVAKNDPQWHDRNVAFRDAVRAEVDRRR